MRLWSMLAAAVVCAGSTVWAQDMDRVPGDIHSSSDMSSTAAITAAMKPAVTGQPFEGQKVTKSVWRLADGTVITHESATKIARDGEGRLREEIQQTRSTSLGGTQSNTTTDMVTISDPIGHSILMITPKSKIAMKMDLPAIPAGLPDSMRKGVRMGGIMGGLPAGASAQPQIVKDGVAAPDSETHDVSLGTETKTLHRTEKLGNQSIAGVLATGKRTITTIPLGAIGNDRPIIVTHEEWYSPDLQMVVKSSDSDPRDGERTMELEGVSRAEPDPSLFKVPEGYKVTDMADMMKVLGSIGKGKKTESDLLK